MTEVNVLSALDAFIATFEPDRSEPKATRASPMRERPLSIERR
jgi:hypothetical protein